MALKHRWYRVFLNGRWGDIAHEAHVLHHDRMKTRIFKTTDWLNASWAFLLNTNLFDTVDFRFMLTDKVCADGDLL